MQLRTWRERLGQTLVFEALGLALVAPAYAAIFGRSGGESLAILLALTAAVMLWSPLHNLVFDVAELRLTGRAAWTRSGWLRALHALSHEISAVAVTLPILLLLAGHSPGEALLVNLGLTAAYTVYTYLFHRLWDRLRVPAGAMPAIA